MHLLITGGSRRDRVALARRLAEGALPPSESTLTLDSATLPFVRPADIGSLRGSGTVTLRVDDLERAFPRGQTGPAQLVLTRPAYLMQLWINAVGTRGHVVLTADSSLLHAAVPGAEKGDGPWRTFTRHDAAGAAQDDSPADDDPMSVQADPVTARLREAYDVIDGVVRRERCEQIARDHPQSAVAQLALASACREVLDAAAARVAIERACALAPDWEAAHFEAGKLSLAMEDLAGARASFARAAELMRGFTAALINLGGVAGELDDPDAAIDAFMLALTFDPANVQVLSNVGVAQRERGRLDESERALIQVTTLAPTFVFGHYNLGHTRFLKGDIAGALAAYERGQHLDPDRNRRQACRLAVVRLAAGDVERAARELFHHADAAPPDERADLLAEAFETVLALRNAGLLPAGSEELVRRLELCSWKQAE